MDANTQAIVDKLNEHYGKEKCPECPKCGTNENVKLVAFGRPSGELQVYAQLGHVILGGCAMLPPRSDGTMQNAKCTACDEDIWS